MEKIVNNKEIGSVNYKKNARAKNLSIRISRDGLVNVTVPGWCTYKKAESFVLHKQAWIDSKILQIRQRDEKKLVWEVGDTLKLVRGEINIVRGGACFAFRETEFGAELAFPSGYNKKKADDRANAREMLAQVGLMMGKKILPDFLKKVSEKYDLPYNKVSVRRAKARWGSCSAKNNISLNSALVFLREDLLEYVCLHELAHTVHKNHSSRFWEFVEEKMPDASTRRHILRNCEILA